MSSPHPQGLGAVQAMRAALADAGLEPQAIDYVNLHGTATPNNDAAEDAAVHAVFGAMTPCSSTKGATGHTLGAAGAVEAAISLLALREGLLPAGLNLRHAGRRAAGELRRRRQPQPRAARGAEQLVRLRWLEREPRVRSRRRTMMMKAMMTTQLCVGVQGVGVLGPGIASWADYLEILRSGAWPASLGAMTTTATTQTTVLPSPMRLPSAERRRAGAAIKVALAVADQAVLHAGVDPGSLATVFTASNGEGANCHNLCETLASSDRSVSPTRFTNSVHNAAAGYWHIAVGSRAASTSLCGFDTSFGAGLLEAATQVAATQQPVLLVATDTPYPEPLHAKRIVRDNFGLALLLTASPSASALPLSPSPASGSASRAVIAGLRLSLHRGAAPQELAATACRIAALEELRRALPAAAGLALLDAIAQLAQQESHPPGTAITGVKTAQSPRREARVIVACPPALQLHIDVGTPW